MADNYVTSNIRPDLKFDNERIRNTFDESVGRVQDEYNQTGVGIGSVGNYDPSMFYEGAAVRPDQTQAERIQEQQQNYLYGGYVGGAEDAIAAARGAVDPYASSLGSMGGDFYGTGMDAQNRAAPIDQYNSALQRMGTSNIYGTADALTQYAQQGPGPSLAQAQLDANTAQSMRQQLAMAGSGRGAGGGAAAFRQAAMNQAQIQGQGNAQAAMLQAQETQDWRNAQLAAYGQAGQLYGLGADSALAGAQYYTGSEQAQTGLNDQFTLGMGGLAVDSQQGAGQLALGGEQLAHQIQGTALSGTQAYESNLTDIYGIDKGVPRGGDQGMTTRDWIGLGLQAAGTAAMFASDIRAKTNIEPTSALETINGFTLPYSAAHDRELAKERDAEARNRRFQMGGQMLSSYGANLMGSDIRAKENVQPASALESISDAGSYSYNYLDPERHGEGTYVGPMAQELENAPGVVYEQPDGTKAIDPGRLTALNTSAISELNEKVDRLAGEGSPGDFNPYGPTEEEITASRRSAVSALARQGVTDPVRALDYLNFDEEGNQIGDFTLDEVKSMMPRRGARQTVNTSVAPSNAGVDEALKSFGNTPPSTGQIAKKREELRATHGSKAAGEFERYAMALRGEVARPSVSIGLAENVQARPSVEFGPAEIEPAPSYDIAFGAPYDVQTRPAPVAQASGPTQPVAYSGDPSRLDFEAQKYGTPVYGAPMPEAPAEQSSGGLMDFVFGPSVGQHVSDVANEEYNNEALRQYFRAPPRVDQYL